MSSWGVGAFGCIAVCRQLSLRFLLCAFVDVVEALLTALMSRWGVGILF
jgi:hypothetical protein